MIYHLFLFITSFALLALAANWIVDSLTFFARLFRWREFVLVYFILVLGAAIPNLSVGFFSAVRGVPDLFFGDVIGNSLITITLITGIGALISKNLIATSRVVQQSSTFLVVVSLLPLFLIMDGELSRGDGIVLLIAFFLYSGWLFSKRKLFEGAYQENGIKKLTISYSLKSLLKIIIGIPLLILAGNLIVTSSSFFADFFGIEIAIFGVLFVALGTSLPEFFFVATAAKRKNNWLVLGASIGDVIVLPTLGLGLLAVISPIRITRFSSFLPLFIFLILANLLFLFFIKTGKKISSKEGILLLSIYFLFMITEIILRILR